MPPLLSFKRTFDTEIAVGDLTIPIHVARLDKAQLEELDEGWARLILMPRGSAIPPEEGASIKDKLEFLRAEQARLDEWNKAVETERFEFFERVLTRYITLDEGLIEDSGQPVTDGQGLLRIFHGRRDVLRDLVDAVRSQNHLTAVMRKNSNSPRDSGPGSAPSSEARGGDKPEATARSAESSSTADSAAATAASSDKADGVESSGRCGGATRLH